MLSSSMQSPSALKTTMMPLQQSLCFSMIVFGLSFMMLMIHTSYAFTTKLPNRVTSQPAFTQVNTKTSLNVWFFGGSESQTTQSGDSCELVAVRIERTSSNSRRISGEITVENTPLEDVWAILTDYDNLSTHVPNLVESRKVRGYSGPGRQGDGSYTCRLYQKGAQKIAGFQFGADVTMNMQEKTVNSPSGDPIKSISFKCVDSLFFSEFDGEWKVQSEPAQGGFDIDGNEYQTSTTVSYVVDVRPKGPVPVAALEWRIREDVPTNLRAVKKAAVGLGARGVVAMKKKKTSAVMRALPAKPAPNGAVRDVKVKNGRNGATPTNGEVISDEGRKNRLKALAEQARGSLSQGPTVQNVPIAVPVQWDADETLGAYLRE